MMHALLLILAAGFGQAAVLQQRQQAGTAIPSDYFQTVSVAFAGPTATAALPPFLAETNVFPVGTSTFIANTPLETVVPIAGNTNNTNIFQYMGNQSPYFVSPGFGANEYPLPIGSNITQVHLLHRHGSRYPSTGEGVQTLGTKLRNASLTGSPKFSGGLSFLNTWKYGLGAEILVPKGRQEMFDSGILFYYNYGQLYNTSTKILARTTGQDRMLNSAEYFMAGFFGLEWTRNATLGVMIEGLNTSLSLPCNNGLAKAYVAALNASATWQNVYLKNATARLQALSTGFNWTISDVYAAQNMCPYEVISYGYSPWCSLFTLDEWLSFEYAFDISFQGGFGFASPAGRAMGISWVEEFRARLQGHVYNLPPGSTGVNTTLDTNNVTFPVNQSLYFDFTHDATIYSVVTALGLTQFNDSMSLSSRNDSRNAILSHLVPFGSRLVFEVIKAPHPVKVTRPSAANATMADFYDSGNATSYVHLMLNQRTVPLWKSYPECGKRDDGWCSMDTFMQILSGLLPTAQYTYACYANYTVGPFGSVTNGVPPAH